MLPKANRLLKKEDFQKAWKSGGSFYTKNLGFKLRKTTNTTLKLGVVVSNKISKLATVRNKIKRQIREAVHSHLKNITPGGYDLVIIALPDILKKPLKDIKKDVVIALNCFKILKK